MTRSTRSRAGLTTLDFAVRIEENRTGFDLRHPIPPWQAPGATPNRSAYQFISVPKKGVDPEVKAALEHWLKGNPPQPNDIVINYWQTSPERLKEVREGR